MSGKRASFVHGRPNVIALECAARTLLGIPALPDSATGPKAQALLNQIQFDLVSMGKDAALKKWADVSVVAYACSLEDDPSEFKVAGKRTPDSLKHPLKEEYHFPDCEALQIALSSSTARARCSAQALALLDTHAAMVDVLPEDWSQ